MMLLVTIFVFPVLVMMFAVLVMILIVMLLVSMILIAIVGFDQGSETEGQPDYQYCILHTCVSGYANGTKNKGSIRDKLCNSDAPNLA